MSVTTDKGIFHIKTPSSSYVFTITPSGSLRHLYYGESISITENSVFCLKGSPRIPTIVNYSNEFPRYYKTIEMEETSFFGKGDLRPEMFQGAIEARGITTFDFVYDSFQIINELQNDDFILPKCDKKNSETLIITLKDTANNILLDLLYTTFDESDVIVRSSRIRNKGNETLTIRRLYSIQMDLIDREFEIITLDGAWARERQIHKTRIASGTFSTKTISGISSAEHNPLIMLKKDDECFLTNLIYSSDHKEIIDVSPYGTVRLLSGINPDSFSWELAPGMEFETPEAIIIHGMDGENAISQCVHEFIKDHILPQYWSRRCKPILLNSWEGMGYNINEDNLKKQIDVAHSLGIELFCIDDGWFGKRNSAMGSLGDWYPDCIKFPKGLKPISDYLHSKNMLFGIWVEPEMISLDSNMFKKHPEWLVRSPGLTPSVGRDQYIIDMTQKEVVDELFYMLEKLISLNDIDYIKWDINRYISDDHSKNIKAFEFRYRWILGFYSLTGRLRKRFETLLFEGCASGGGRYDLGVLSYADQFWGSDNTDATFRLSIAQGTSFGYPISTLGAHVSRIPNGITTSEYDIETAFNVNAFGAFGYELDVCAIDDTTKRIIKDQILFYKVHAKLIQQGKFSHIETNHSVIWTSSNEDASKIIALYYQTEKIISRQVIRRLVVKDCKAEKSYRVKTRRQWVTNKSLCEKRGGIHLTPEINIVVPGGVLKHEGLPLYNVFEGTDYTEDMFHLAKDDSLLFIIEEA